MEQKFAEMYRQWIQEQPETDIETIEQHVARFMVWLCRELNFKLAA